MRRFAPRNDILFLTAQRNDHLPFPWVLRHFRHRGGKGGAGRIAGRLCSAEQTAAEIGLTGRCVELAQLHIRRLQRRIQGIHPL